MFGLFGSYNGCENDTPSIKSIHVVSEFKEVFHNGLPNMPLDRHIFISALILSFVHTRCLSLQIAWVWKNYESLGFKSKAPSCKALGRCASHSPTEQSLSIRPWGGAPAIAPKISLRSLGHCAPYLFERQRRQFILLIPNSFILVPKLYTNVS